MQAPQSRWNPMLLWVATLLPSHAPTAWLQVCILPRWGMVSHQTQLLAYPLIFMYAKSEKFQILNNQVSQLIWQRTIWSTTSICPTSKWCIRTVEAYLTIPTRLQMSPCLIASTSAHRTIRSDWYSQTCRWYPTERSGLVTILNWEGSHRRSNRVVWGSNSSIVLPVRPCRSHRNRRWRSYGARQPRCTSTGTSQSGTQANLSVTAMLSVQSTWVVRILTIGAARRISRGIAIIGSLRRLQLANAIAWGRN